MAGKKPLLAQQPAKGVYALLFVLTTIARLPLLSLYYAVPSNRPVRTWSFKAAFFNKVTEILFRFQAKIQLKTSDSLDPGKDGKNFVTIPAAPDRLLQQPLVSTNVKPCEIGGLWVPQLLDSSALNDRSRVLLHFHGGAFVVLGPRDGYARNVPKLICEELPAAAALSVQYRLSSNDNGTFPAALQDAVAAYWYILEEKKVAPSNIILSGDSSGSHIVIGLLRYLSKHPATLPLPKAALLSSPWVNLTEEATSVENRHPNKSDYLSTEFLSWGAKAFTPPGTAFDNEWITPLHHPFATKVPIWVQTGTAEYFYADNLTWVQEMRSVGGNKVELFEQKDAMHAIPAIADEVGMRGIVVEGIRHARKFLDANA